MNSLSKNNNFKKLPSNILPRRVDLFSEVNRELDNMFNEIFSPSFYVNKKSKGYPLLDVVQKDEKLTLQYTVPGVKLEDLNVEVTEDDLGKVVSVEGKLSKNYTHKEDNYAIRELSSREFKRLIRLPENVSDDEPEASLKDGILTLVFKTKTEKQDVVKSKKLKIKSY